MGSTAQTERHHTYSDYDILIVMNETPLLWTCLTAIDGKLTDLVFTGQQELVDLLEADSIAIATNEASFIHWLLLGNIIHDPTNLLLKLQTHLQSLSNLPLKAEETGLYGVWFGIHYNYLQNVRMWQSGDPIYHMALHMRLLNGLSQLRGHLKSLRPKLK